MAEAAEDSEPCNAMFQDVTPDLPGGWLAVGWAVAVAIERPHRKRDTRLTPDGNCPFFHSLCREREESLDSIVSARPF